MDYYTFKFYFYQVMWYRVIKHRNNGDNGGRNPH